MLLLVLFIAVNLVWLVGYKKLDDDWFDLCMGQNFDWYRVCNRVQNSNGGGKEYDLRCCIDGSMHKVEANCLIDAMKKLAEDISVPVGSISKVEEDSNEEQ